MKRSIILIIILLLGFMCSKTQYTTEMKQDYSTIGDPVSGDWLVSSLTAEPDTLNPITATDAYESRINFFILESLIERDMATLELKPKLAHKWEISPDKLKYTFYIRKGIKWHDGQEFTAEDVVFSFQKINDPKVDAAPLRNYYRDVKKVEAIDKYTVQFTYNKPYFLALEFCGGLPVVPKHIFNKGDFNKHPYNRKPVGTGPYVFDKWETGKQIVLKRNENYWNQKESGHLDKIVFKIITDDTVRLQLLKKGDLDFNSLLPIQWVRQTVSKKFKEKFRKLSFYNPYYSYIGWNMRNPLFKDRDVREALTRLVNKKSILKNLFYGLGQTTTGPFYLFSKAYNKNIKPFEHDPKKAIALLKKAGWQDTNNDGILDKNGMDFKFTFMISHGATITEQIATILKEDLKKVGIVMDIKRLEWAAFLKQIDDRKFDACILGWSMGIEQDPYQLWHSSQTENKGSNLTGFKNKRVDELIEKIRTEFNDEKRYAMMHEVHSIIHQEQPYTFLFCTMGLVAVERRFQNTRTYNIRPGLNAVEWWVPADIQKFKK